MEKKRKEGEVGYQMPPEMRRDDDLFFSEIEDLIEWVRCCFQREMSIKGSLVNETKYHEAISSLKDRMIRSGERLSLRYCSYEDPISVFAGNNGEGLPQYFMIDFTDNFTRGRELHQELSRLRTLDVESNDIPHPLFLLALLTSMITSLTWCESYDAVSFILLGKRPIVKPAGLYLYSRQLTQNGAARDFGLSLRVREPNPSASVLADIYKRFRGNRLLSGGRFYDRRTLPRGARIATQTMKRFVEERRPQFSWQEVFEAYNIEFPERPYSDVNSLRRAYQRVKNTPQAENNA